MSGTAKEFGFDAKNKDLLERIDVIDCEVHTTESTRSMIEFLEDEELRNIEENGYRLELGAHGPGGGSPWNYYNPRSGSENGGRPLITQPLKSLEDIEKQADVMSDITFVNSLNSILLAEIPNTHKQVRYMRAANRWNRENLMRDKDGFFTGVTIVPEHPEESVEEIAKYADEDSVKYIFTLAPHGKPFGNKMYEPIFEAAEKHGLPIVMHGNAVAMEGFPGGELDMDTCFEHRALSQFLGHVRNATSLIGEGIPERYDVDFVFIEHCLSWVPLLMNRLDREIEVRGYETRELSKKPSEYLQEFYYGTQPLEKPQNPEYLGTMLEMMGLEDQVIFTSDYPHSDSDSVGAIADHEGLTEKQKVKILQDNAKQLFDLE